MFDIHSFLPPPPLPSAPQGDSADDPLGIDSWAASCGIAPHTALALAAAVLAGVAGPLARLPAKGPRTFPGINLAGRENDPFLRMAVDSLVGFLRPMEEGLIKRSQEISSEEMDAVMFEAGRRRSAPDLIKLGEPGPLDKEYADGDPYDRLRADMQTSEQIIRYEALARARFLVSGRVPQSLAKLLSGYHYGHGLLAGALESLPRDVPKRNLRLDEYLRCFAGAEASPSKRHKINPDSVFLKGILFFPADQFEWLVNHRREFLSEAIPVASSPDTEATGIDEIRALRFIQLFRRTAQLALASRRGHTSVITDLHSEAAFLDFVTRQRAFLRELQELPDNLRVASAASLPVTMVWALLLLAGRNDRDGYVLETAFDSARRVVDDARSLFVKSDQAALGGKRLRDARKLLTRLAKKGPSPRWELLRGLDQQSLKIHGPVIRVLIELQIITQDQDNLLHLGPVPPHRLSLENLIDLD